MTTELTKELHKFKRLIEKETPSSKELNNFLNFVLIDKRLEAERIKGWQWINVLNSWANNYQIGNKNEEETASAIKAILLLNPIEE
ncbi:Hypothetical protein MAGb_3020 [Mycoplasmopsis agalactiae 14628]|uniref:Uncharacterized protein n=1 Tax=Mycoplasmopsis agalactiae 14628 TaxID=1110504 RepID=I5D684_MYCAA|nr:hypothetical protein [Mycoplasmopsis agalactiae]EIN15193.1 Hypothetical protein MAGb_3020 [Mycoplasmopsis agalactiae 14628]